MPEHSQGQPARYLTFAASVNKLCNDFKQAEMTADDFKCLIFAQGSVSAEDAEFRQRVLTKLEKKQRLTLQKIGRGQSKSNFCQVSLINNRGIRCDSD